MKTVFSDGMILTKECANALNNPVYKQNPQNDGEIPYPTDLDAMGVSSVLSVVQVQTAASIASLASTVDTKAPQTGLTALQETVSAISEAVDNEITRSETAESNLRADIAASSFSKAIPGAGPFQSEISLPVLSEALSFPSKGLWEIGVHLTFRANWVSQNSGDADHETWMLALFRNQGGAQVGRAINGLRVSVTSVETPAYFTKYAAIAADIGDTELAYGLGLHIVFPIVGDATHALYLQNGEFTCRKISA